MIDKFKNIFSIPDLRKRVFFTLGVLVSVRLGAHIPIPGIDANALSAAFQGYQNTLLGLYNLFAGGAFEKATLFALGIMPYISASIIIQLMSTVVPYFQRLQKEGEAGRKKNHTNNTLSYGFDFSNAGLWYCCRIFTFNVFRRSISSD